MQPEVIGIACDHAGFEKKNLIIDFLKTKGYTVKDFGTYSPDSTDYADFAHPLASSVETGECLVGISLCGSGNGINMTVNKHRGIRSALCWNTEIALLARQHNDANICALPARFLSSEEVLNIVEVFLNSGFEAGRHLVRINKIPI
ncbi:MAG TPA: RpiB/LacA/LacB family sugar-phosphate isomerase [Bacteroidales bacterium]|nr:RpiB/LacA/LacB family sugar-phosphate isomerase [Bacteroidales bacterium]